MQNIHTIYFPNTESECDLHCYSTRPSDVYVHPKSVDKFKLIQKNGEMGLINWIQVIKDNKVIAEIKESVCNIYGEDDL